MEGKRIAQFFIKNGLHLRPESLAKIIQEFKQQSDQEQFLHILLSNIQAILLEKNMLSAMNVEPDIAQEAIYVMHRKKAELQNPDGVPQQVNNVSLKMAIEEQDRSKESNDEVLMPNLVLLDNFATRRLHFDDKSRKITLKEQPVDFNADSIQDFFVEKYSFLRFLIEKSGKYQFEQKESEKLSGKKKITEIGSLKGQREIFTIFGVIYNKQGKFYLQDLISEVRLSFVKTKKTRGYFTVGSFVMVRGQNNDSVVQVLKIKYPKINTNICTERYFLEKLAFYDALKSDLDKLQIDARKPLDLIAEAKKLNNGMPIALQSHGSSNSINHIYNFSHMYEAFKSDCQIVIINDFKMTEDNIKNFEKVICEFYQKPLVAIFLCGQFFEFNAFNSQNQKATVKRSFNQLNDLIQKYNEIFKHTRLFLVPAVEDFGLATFPRKPLLESVFEKLTSKHNNIFLCQNPCRFMVMNKSFVISKLNLISKAVRNSVAPIDGFIEPFEHLHATIFGQRNLLPFAFQEYPVIPKLRAKLMMFELLDFTILADDFAAPNVVVSSNQNDAGFSVFPGSFSSFGSYVVIRPQLNDVQIKYLD
jgi:hypothetical protein